MVLVPKSLLWFFLGEKVPQDAQDHKNELSRITKYIMDLQEKVKKECDAFSEVGFKLLNIEIIHPSTQQLLPVK